MIFNIFSMVIVLILQKKNTNNVSLGAVQKLYHAPSGGLADGVILRFYRKFI